MKRFILFVVVFTVVWIGFSLDMDAQCAMCKATAESATDNIDESIGEGLNKGILYLMGIPYALLILSVFVFFRKPLKRFYHELSHH